MTELLNFVNFSNDRIYVLSVVLRITLFLSVVYLSLTKDRKNAGKWIVFTAYILYVLPLSLIDSVQHWLHKKLIRNERSIEHYLDEDGKAVTKDGYYGIVETIQRSLVLGSLRMPFELVRSLSFDPDLYDEMIDKLLTEVVSEDPSIIRKHLSAEAQEELFLEVENQAAKNK